MQRFRVWVKTADEGAEGQTATFKLLGEITAKDFGEAVSKAKEFYGTGFFRIDDGANVAVELEIS